MQKVAYYSCQNYSRSRARIDIPTCIRYADLCCGRAKVHAKYTMAELERNQDGNKNSDDAIIRSLNSHVQLTRDVKNGLYYC